MPQVCNNIVIQNCSKKTATRLGERGSTMMKPRLVIDNIIGKQRYKNYERRKPVRLDTQY